MPRDFKQRPARKSAPRSSRHRAPRRWTWFGAGLCVGAAATAALFLVEPGPGTLGSAPPAAAGRMERRAQDPPRFEFYTLLPEKEIAIPETALAPEPPPPAAGDAAPASPAPAEPGRYLLQVASFRRLEDADRLKARIAFMGLQASIQTVSIDGTETWHRVRVGPLQGSGEVAEARQRLRENELESLLLKLK